MATETENGKLKGTDKKKARRAKAKQEKRQLKEESKQIHATLHQAQEAEAQSRGSKKGGGKQEPTIKVADGAQVVLDYVPEPLETLQDLRAAADAAAVAANPYEGIEGLEVSEKDDKADVAAELQRIAKHFTGEVEQAPQEEDAGPETVEGTDAVVTTGTEDDSAKRAAEEEAGAQTCSSCGALGARAA